MKSQYKRQDIENAALGKLCNVFSKINDNDALIQKIQRTIKHRDHLAHRALTLRYDQSTSEEEYLEAANELAETMRDVGEILTEVHLELDKLMLIGAIKNHG